MGAFLEGMENEHGMPVSDGDVIKADFSEVLNRGLEGIMKITVRDATGKPSYQRISLSDLSGEGIAEYHLILGEIAQVSTGLCISPIDVLIEKIKDAGYSVAEVTGRKIGLKLATTMASSLNGELGITSAAAISHKKLVGTVIARKKENTNDAFRRFNNNEVDVLLINQSGSTGASAHAIPTSKVPASEVRQRVMIVLQAELDINTEVQKRGRINRTGQILKPIYDYLTSAIPAEQRLMMMLQKKLKSLDANTSSNQKQSASMLDVPDFLNKYGDRVVKEYLMDNPEVNEMLDDPLKVLDSGEESNSERTIENAAQKVSGRVAVLSTEMQKAFYDEIGSRYNDLVEYLKQASEYDLELEAMNLQAETIKSSVICVGTGGGSPFGENVNLEQVEVNVLRKPYTYTELSNILADSLGGRPAQELQQELTEEFRQFTERRLTSEIETLTTKFDRLLAEVPALKSIQRIDDEAERRDAITKQRETVEEGRRGAMTKAQVKSRNIAQSLSQYFRFFHPGRMCNYPIAVIGMGIENVPTVFLGFVIDRRKVNPFAPSAVKLRFAIANGMKYLELPASMHLQISPILSASYSMRQDPSRLQSYWEGAVANGLATRKKRYIITGNLLQALGTFKGRLIDYTTMAGGNEKGLLMPESWNPDERGSGGDKVTLPIAKAGDVIRSMQSGTSIKCSNGLIIAREYGQRYKLYVPASRQGGGDIYLDRELHELVENGIWEKQSDKMITYVLADRIDAVLVLLGSKHPGTVPVARHQVTSLVSSSPDSGLTTRFPIRLPSPPGDPEPVATNAEVRLRALALELEMEMEMELA
jgi:hypothetical protein